MKKRGDKMRLVLFEVDFSAPLSLREKVTFHSTQFEELVPILRQIRNCIESMLICTCNRTVLLCVIEGEKNKSTEAIKDVINIFATWSNGKKILEFLREYNDFDAIKMLIQLGIGERSMVVGEPQILGQISFYFNVSRSVGMTGKYINWLIPRILFESRRLRKNFCVDEGSISLAGLVSTKISSFINSVKINKPRVLIVGWGDITSSITRILKSKFDTYIVVANRNPKKITSHLVEVVSLNSLDKVTNEFDVILTMLGMQLKYLFSKKNFSNDKPRMIIDLGVPMNVNPDVATINDTSYFNIDSFRDHSTKNKQLRLRRFQILRHELLIRSRQVWKLIQRRHREEEIYRKIDLCADQILGKITCDRFPERSSEISKFRIFVVKSLYKFFTAPIV